MQHNDERAHPVESKAVKNNFHGRTLFLQYVLVLLISSLLLTSCEALGGIFKAGMNFGIILVIVVIVLIVMFIVRMGKKRAP